MRPANKNSTVIPGTPEGALSALLGVADVQKALIDALEACRPVDEPGAGRSLLSAARPVIVGGAEWPATEIYFALGIIDVLIGLVASLVAANVIHHGPIQKYVEQIADGWRRNGDEVRCRPAELMLQGLRQLQKDIPDKANTAGSLGPAQPRRMH